MIGHQSFVLYQDNISSSARMYLPSTSILSFLFNISWPQSLEKINANNKSGAKEKPTESLTVFSSFPQFMSPI